MCIRDRCSGGSSKAIVTCCTANNTCEINQGDCDYDDDCKGDLICGHNNCGASFTMPDADCCIVKPGKQLITNINFNELIVSKIKVF